ncbi:MAG: acyltransferase family protein [Candidatus Caccovivens sp.]
MNKTQSNRNVYLDIFKIFLCFLVICIHLAGETYSHFPVYRLAVPMFFLISGYFSNHQGHENAEQKAFNAVKRTLKYMLIGFLINIIFDFVNCFVTGKGVGYFWTTLFYEDFFLNFVVLNTPITYTGAQLWFLIALFFVSIVHWLLVKYNKTKYYYFIVPICLALYFFFSTYMYIFQITDMPIRYVRNAWLFGLPMFGLGFLLAKINFNKKSFYKYIYLALGILFFILQVYEDRLFRFLSNDAPLNAEMYVSSVISVVMFLQFFIGIKKCNCNFYYKWIGKNAYFYIYVLHMAVAVTISHITSFNNLLLKSFVVLIISFMLYEIGHLICMLIKYIKQKKEATKIV